MKFESIRNKQKKRRKTKKSKILLFFLLWSFDSSGTLDEVNKQKSTLENVQVGFHNIHHYSTCSEVFLSFLFKKSSNFGFISLVPCLARSFQELWCECTELWRVRSSLENDKKKKWNFSFFRYLNVKCWKIKFWKFLNFFSLYIFTVLFHQFFFVFVDLLLLVSPGSCENE